MITIKTNEKPSIIEVEIEGKVKENDIKEFENYFKQKRKSQDEINLLMSIKEIGYSFNGLIEDFKFESKYWNEFNRIAILSDKKWLEFVSKIADSLPNVEVKHFDYDEKEKAINWFA
ncbi:MAG: STAS/SEC14 domain-containing protein [Eubacteriales bacterium]